MVELWLWVMIHVLADDPSNGEGPILVTSAAKMPVICASCGHADAYSRINVKRIQGEPTN